MTSLGKGSLSEISDELRVLIREVIQDSVPQIIKDTVPQMIEEAVPRMIRDETADMRAEISVQGSILRSVRSDVSQLKHSVRGQSVLLKEQGVLLEDLESRFTSVTELLISNLDVEPTIVDHEARIRGLESFRALWGTSN